MTPLQISTVSAANRAQYDALYRQLDAQRATLARLRSQLAACDRRALAVVTAELAAIECRICALPARLAGMLERRIDEARRRLEAAQSADDLQARDAARDELSMLTQARVDLAFAQRRWHVPPPREYAAGDEVFCNRGLPRSCDARTLRGQLRRLGFVGAAQVHGAEVKVIDWLAPPHGRQGACGFVMGRLVSALVESMTSAGVLRAPAGTTPAAERLWPRAAGAISCNGFEPGERGCRVLVPKGAYECMLRDLDLPEAQWPALGGADYVAFEFDRLGVGQALAELAVKAHCVQLAFAGEGGIEIGEALDAVANDSAAAFARDPSLAWTTLLTQQAACAVVAGRSAAGLSTSAGLEWLASADTLTQRLFRAADALDRLDGSTLRPEEVAALGITFGAIVDGTLPERAARVFDALDGSGPGGAPAIEIVAADLGGGIVSRTMALPGGLVLSTLLADRRIVSITETWELGAEQTVTRVFDAGHRFISQGHLVRSDDGSCVLTTTRADGSGDQRIYCREGTMLGAIKTPSCAETFGGAFLDPACSLGALQRGGAVPGAVPHDSGCDEERLSLPAPPRTDPRGA
jgi:hypothetical protein